MEHDSDEDRAQRRRQRSERRRKERILHTRISEDLEDDLRRAAEELRVPVSNLVRNVLEEAVTVVEAVSDEFGELIDEVVDSAEQVADRFKRSADGSHRKGGGRWTEAARAARARSSDPGRSGRTRSSRSRPDRTRPDRTAPDPSEPAAPAPPAPPMAPEPAAAASPSAPILGWQPLVLNHEQRCPCGAALSRGESAHVAITSAGLSEQYRCGDCIAGLGSGS